eukprot:scaffold71801_cov16-Prasinocladus_malaysianus.AAC.1
MHQIPSERIKVDSTHGDHMLQDGIDTCRWKQMAGGGAPCLLCNLLCWGLLFSGFDTHSFANDE